MCGDGGGEGRGGGTLQGLADIQSVSTVNKEPADEWHFYKRCQELSVA